MCQNVSNIGVATAVVVAVLAKLLLSLLYMLLINFTMRHTTV